jgi:hypothetical protein
MLQGSNVGIKYNSVKALLYGALFPIGTSRKYIVEYKNFPNSGIPETFILLLDSAC